MKQTKDKHLVLGLILFAIMVVFVFVLIFVHNARVGG